MQLGKSIYKLFILAISMIVIQACEVVTVEPPDIDVSDIYTPEYVIQGRIIDVDNNGGVIDAEILLNDRSVFSDENGFFEFKSESPVASGTIVEVFAEGYIKSNSTMFYGDDPPIVYYLNLYLTPELPSGNIDLVTGGELVFGSVHVSFPGGNYAILNGDSIVSVPVGITPLNNNSSLGNQTAATIKTLMFNPVGIHFDKAAVFRIDVPSEFSYSELSMHKYSDSLDIWIEMNDEVFYDSLSNQIEFSLRDLPIGIKITDPNMITIYSDGIYSESPVIYEPNSCDCEGAFLWSGGYYIRQLTITGSGVLTELNSMHFFSDNNMPYYPALYISGIFEAPVVTNLSIPECKTVVVEISRWYREITGIYVYVNETKTYNVRYYFGVSVTTTIVDCPLTSNCHQGCI